MARNPPKLCPRRIILGIPMVSLHVSIEVTNSFSAPSGSLGNAGLELRPKPSRSKVCSVRRALRESMLRIQRPTPPPKPCTITKGVRSPSSGLTVTVQILFWFGRDTYRARNLFWRPGDRGSRTASSFCLDGHSSALSLHSHTLSDLSHLFPLTTLSP